MRRSHAATLAAGVIVTLAVSPPVLAQGNSQKKNPTPPPSRNELSPAAPPVSSSSSATPLAWVDDASLLAPGQMALSVSAMRWQGGGVGEVDAPIVDAAFGLSRRVQVSASIPRVQGDSDPLGAAGGLGTSFFSAKIALYDIPARRFKLAASPTLQLLGAGVVESLGAAQSRARWGLPVSAEVSSGTMRLYGGGGYFSPGLWFSGAAIGFAVNGKTNASVGVSHAWRTTDTTDLPLSDRDRNELSGGVSYALGPRISVFGSAGRTFATREENGAGTSISGGISVFFAADAGRP